MFFGHLCDFQELYVAFVFDEGASFDVCFGLVGHLHQKLEILLDHEIEDAEIHCRSIYFGIIGLKFVQ